MAEGIRTTSHIISNNDGGYKGWKDEENLPNAYAWMSDQNGPQLCDTLRVAMERFRHICV